MREARARERAASGRPLTPDEQLEEAIERRDLAAVEARLTAYGRSLSLPMRVAALRELGRDWDAWRLLEAAGMTDDKRLIASEDAAALVSDVRDLREQHLSGAWFWGSVDQLGPLEVRNAGARLELRARALLFGLELGAAELWALPPDDKLLARGRREQRVRASAKLRERIGETTLRAGAEFLPDGYRPFAQLEQLISVRDGRFELRALGAFNEIPMHSPLLRVAGVRDGLDVDMSHGPGPPLRAGHGRRLGPLLHPLAQLPHHRDGGAGRAGLPPAGGQRLHPPARRRLLQHGAAGRARHPRRPDALPDATGRPERSALAGVLDGRRGPVHRVDPRRCRARRAGPHVSLRYYLDGWAGHMWPARKPSYTVHAGARPGLRATSGARARGFYFTDLRSAAGERYAGATLNYTLRWFR